MAARSRWNWPTTTVRPFWKFEARHVQKNGRPAAGRGAALRLRGPSDGAAHPGRAPKAESPAATPTPEPTPTFTEEQKKYGSASLLSEPTVLVSVFLNDAARGLTWDEADRTAAVQQTRMAVDWITAQAESYGVMPDLICDRTEDGSNAALTRSYLVQSAMRRGEVPTRAPPSLRKWTPCVSRWPRTARLAAYGTRHIGFLFYLPISGTSFTMAHYADDGEYFYYEYSCLYRHDAYTDGERESPATYAHEIRTCSEHLTSTRAAATPYVDRALVDYVAETYPDDIMVSTYEDDGTSQFDVITKEISPLTAYCLGLTDTCPELEQFPLLTQVEPGVFRRELTADTSDETADAWPGAVAA